MLLQGLSVSSRMARISVLVLLCFSFVGCQDSKEILRVLEAIKDLSKDVEILKTNLQLTKAEILLKLETTKTFVETKISAAEKNLRIDLGSQIDQLATKCDKVKITQESTKADAFEPLPSSYVEISSGMTLEGFLEKYMEKRDDKLEDAFNATCGGLELELDTSMRGFRQQLNTTLETIKNGYQETTVASRCEEGWKFFDHSCYYFSFSEGNWTQGREECLQMDADYVKINSTDEWNFVAGHISSNTWVGLSDQETEGTYKWISDGSISVPERHTLCWHRHQPDNHEGAEDCVHYWLAWEKVLWNDARCSATMRYICEKQPSDQAT